MQKQLCLKRKLITVNPTKMKLKFVIMLRSSPGTKAGSEMMSIYIYKTI